MFIFGGFVICHNVFLWCFGIQSLVWIDSFSRPWCRRNPEIRACRTERKFLWWIADIDLTKIYHIKKVSQIFHCCITANINILLFIVKLTVSLDTCKPHQFGMMFIVAIKRNPQKVSIFVEMFWENYEKINKKDRVFVVFLDGSRIRWRCNCFSGNV